MASVRLSSPLVEPRPGSAYAEVPAPDPRRWRRDERELQPVIAGAGREWSLDELLEATSTTAFLVVVDSVLVHERYFAGATPEDRLLGNSATKSALALLTGMAVAHDHLPDLDARVTEFVPEPLG